MKQTMLEQLAKRILSAKHAQEKAERKKRAAEEEMQRIRERIQALCVDPDNLDEAVKKLEQEIEANLVA